jgi:two-component system chemotaxis response regulator CheB
MYKAIIIGGSAGSFQVISKILQHLPKDIPVPVFLVLHRLKHVRSGFVEALSIKSNIPIKEPYDKETYQKGIAYLAPANYHMYFDFGNKITLSTEEQVNHSRPAIDISFMSAAYLFQDKLIGVILSGANKDGVKGMISIQEMGGVTIVQDPKDSQIETMPQGTLDKITPDFILNQNKIAPKLIDLLN